jgi:hypothetical protein
MENEITRRVAVSSSAWSDGLCHYSFGANKKLPVKNGGLIVSSDPIFSAFSQKRIGKLAPLVEFTFVSPMNLEQK